MDTNYQAPSLPIICLVGPTAVGKSQVAIELAEKINAEIINADSRQFYRELNIGTAKPTQAQRERATHHMIDCATVEAPWSVATFVDTAEEVIQQMMSKNRIPLMVGGTGLYYKSLIYGLSKIPDITPAVREQVRERHEREGLEGMSRELHHLDSELTAKFSTNDTQRILRAYEVYVQTGKSLRSFWQDDPRKKGRAHITVCLNMPRDVLYERIHLRVSEMLKQGLKQEASLLWQQYPQNELLGKTIGYAEWQKYGFDQEDLVVTKIQQNTRNFAKRQLTWFKKEPEVHWIDVCSEKNVIDDILSCIKSAM